MSLLILIIFLLILSNEVVRPENFCCTLNSNNINEKCIDCSTKIRTSCSECFKIYFCSSLCNIKVSTPILPTASVSIMVLLAGLSTDTSTSLLISTIQPSTSQNQNIPASSVNSSTNLLCTTNPCLNNGKCLSNGQCSCSILYNGNLCENNAPLIEIAVITSICSLAIISVSIFLIFYCKKANKSEENTRQIVFEDTMPNVYVDAVKIEEIVLSGSQQNSNRSGNEFADIYSHIHSKEPKIKFENKDYD